MLKRVLAVLALAAFAPAQVSAQGFSTTGGYGNAVLDTRGAAYVNIEGLSPTYSYVINDYAPATSATDMLTICGSATKTIRVLRVQAGGDATAASIYDVYLYKRTTANTGGTATNPTPAKRDSQDAAASATLSLYSANPSGLGTGTMFRGGHALLAAATSPSVAPLWIDWVFGNTGERQVILRGAAECLAVSNNGNSVPSGTSIYITIDWEEV
jgi:hypothetical protein